MEIFKLDISDIRHQKDAQKSLDYEVQLGEVNVIGQDIDLGAVNIKGDALNIGEGILLKITAEGQMVLNCSRCLDKFKHPLKIRLEEFYSFGKTEAEHFVEGDSIDISSLVLETLALNLDIKFLCDKDCAGLCPRCGENLNKGPCECKDEPIDMRLRKLQEWKKQ